MRRHSTDKIYALMGVSAAQRDTLLSAIADAFAAVRARRC